MRVSEFGFELPEELIAQHPPAQRGSSRMLVLDRATGAVRDGWFRELPELLRAGDLLVLNDSRVLPARLFARRAGAKRQALRAVLDASSDQHEDLVRLQAGDAQKKTPEPTGTVEILLTEEVEAEPALQTPDVGDAAGQPQGKVWKVLARPAKKVVPGERLLFFDEDKSESGFPAGMTDKSRFPSGMTTKRSEGASGRGAPVLQAEVLSVGCYGERTVRFAPVEDFYGVVSRIGHMPLPPYIRREQAEGPDSDEDRERYQTVYARQVGSAAAPTAGLHFTPEVLEALERRGVEVRRITLHVGLGTFQPVRVENVEEIRLHAERYTMPEETAEALKRALREGRRVIAVGTTTTRTLEHVAAEAGAGERENWVERIEAHSGSTSIFLRPGHRFRVVSGLLTNFHLPESTLVMLVSAMATPEGDPNAGRQRVLAAYRHAVEAGYRFYSYGDCMLVV